MAANINDKITTTLDTNNPNVAHVVADRSPGSQTLQLDNIAGWTEETAVHFSTYREDAEEEVIEGTQTDWKAIANTSNNTLTQLTRVAGAADTGNLIGDIVEMMPTASWAADLADALLTIHETDGTLKDKVVGLAKINGGSTAGPIVTDASGNVSVGTGDQRAVPRATSTASTATLTPNIDSYNIYTVTAQATSMALANPTGTPNDGDVLLIRLLATGATRALTIGNQYNNNSGLGTPTTITTDKWLTLGIAYNTTPGHWQIISITRG